MKNTVDFTGYKIWNHESVEINGDVYHYYDETEEVLYNVYFVYDIIYRCESNGALFKQTINRHEDKFFYDGLAVLVKEEKISYSLYFEVDE